MIDDEEREPEADHALRVLKRRPPATLDWRPPDVVRRIVVRRRWRRGIGAAVVIAAAISGAVTLTNQTSPTRQPQAVATGPTKVAARLDGAVQLVADTTSAARPDARAAAQVSAAEQALSVALLKQLSGSSNSAVSPLSLYLALGMLQNGAAGQTAAQIAHALQAGSLSTGEQDAGLATLSAELNAAAAKDGITLQSANSLWQQQGFPLRPEFLADLATYFHSGVWQVDFQRDMPAALRAINTWTSQQTHGKITKLFDHLDPTTTVAVLANAVYFHAAWLAPFEPDETKPGPFTTASGKSVTAKYMAGSGGGIVGDGYEAAQLPYTGGRFAALAIMPLSESLPAFVDTLGAQQITAIAHSLRPNQSVALPRFTTTPSLNLVPVLKSLGMRDAFTDTADFSALSTMRTKVEQAIQRVYLAVGEHGTTAAAVTGLSIGLSSAVAQPTIRFDRPFLFLVRDTKTGAILFAAQITDPTAG